MQQRNSQWDGLKNLQVCNNENIRKKWSDGVLKGLKVNKQGKYNNWFQPYLWPPIMATIKKYHGNRSKDFHFFQNTYRNPRCPNVYETSRKYNFYEWFTSTKKLKPNYINVTHVGFTF